MPDEPIIDLQSDHYFMGEALGVAEGTVKSRLHHALEKLRGDARAKKWFQD